MNGLFEAAKEVCGFMSEMGWRFCLIGGLAVQKWGEPRTTLDADITLLAGFGSERDFVEPLLSRFPSRIENGLDFALKNRVLLLQGSNGRDVDVTLGALPFEERMIERATSVELAPGFSLPCCTAEDLFVMKVFASRPKDLIDAESIVNRQLNLDNAYILSELAELAQFKTSSDILGVGRNLLLKKS
ncbi:MAG: nucleotidyl transferase AbiEii/AbiGii toxin family protein [Candidatus Omnitrophica bacterium]|nr:nucleotidyl transferase AbiEii/AbiGii toxin family protein [Candidatus Omnitrophota bacterium]